MGKHVKTHKPVKNPHFYSVDFLEKRLEKIEEKEDQITDKEYALRRRVYKLSMMKPKMRTPFLNDVLKTNREELRHGEEELEELVEEKKAIKRAIKQKKDKEKSKKVGG